MLHKKLKSFPEDFLWGASSSAYQIEGANLEDGKGPSCQDVKEVPEGTSDLTVCADQYHRYKEDIALMAEMGFKTYRFSIAWTRILPEGTGEVNPKGIEYYNNLINENKFNEWYLNVKNRYIDKTIKANRTKVQNNSKVVYQLNKDTLEIIQEFNSSILASESTGVKSQSINRVCRHGCNTAGGYSWIYKEEYHSITKEELIKLYSHKYKKPSSTEHYERNKVKVICLNTKQVFDGMVDAIEYFNLCKGARIDAVCRGVRKSAGKINGEPAKWMYYEDYLKTIK